MRVKHETATIVQYAKSFEVLLKHVTDSPKCKLGHFGLFLVIQNKVSIALQLLNKDADDTVACFSLIFNKYGILEKPTHREI